MRSMCLSSLSWPFMEVCTCCPLQLLMKWLGLRNGTYDADDIQSLHPAEGESSGAISEDTKSGNSSNGDTSGTNGESVLCMRPTFQSSKLTKKLRITVTTWNVAGKPPTRNLNLGKCLGLNFPEDFPADIYVIGFQEVVPLNFVNVFCVEDTQPVVLWEELIRKFLNSPDERPLFEGDEANLPLLKSESINQDRKVTYARIASKQMVGIHISIWIQKKYLQDIRSVAVSCVSLGILGCLGNKGSIAVSLLLHETSFCFICTHLRSGDAKGDEARRNADVKNLISNTIFEPGTAPMCHPRTIYDHNQIIWLGDMNYRINLSDNEIRCLISKRDWDTLLKQDQLKQNLESKTFSRWKEGTIMFSPTYKYKFGSDEYVGGADHEGRRRSPAWCDRILWIGDRMNQELYLSCESHLSDHRPVVAVFSAEVKMCSETKNAGTCKTS